MNHAPQFVEKALVTIAEEIVIEYDAEIKTLTPDDRTQRKALTIQREIAKLCNHAGLNGFAASSFDEHMALADKRFRNITKPYPYVTSYYKSLSETDRRTVLPYLRSLYFMTVTFLIPWKNELAQAEEAGDVIAVFELKLKINTVARILDARNAWWQKNALHLPVIPAEIRDGKELSL